MEDERSAYEKARDRLDKIYQFDEDELEFIFADWREGDEHFEWLLTATLKEILDWGEAANWGKE